MIQLQNFLSLLKKLMAYNFFSQNSHKKIKVLKKISSILFLKPLFPCIIFLSFSFLFADISPSIQGIYKSLDPHSLSQLFAFYELYPKTNEGKKALKKALKLLHAENLQKKSFSLPKIDIEFIISLINDKNLNEIQLQKEQLELIEELGKNLCNRKLKGHKVKEEKDLFSLAAEEIDIARAIFLSSIGPKDNNQQKMRSYEAFLDLMALQVLARLNKDSTNIDKIQAINQFIFFEMHFRYPPRSLEAKEIDTFTFLPSVMDGRRGVCLGVSILYLCIAQRIGLPLEIATPPGHIFLRYKHNGEYINIETTARGIHLPTEIYLGIETHQLTKRNYKDVIGLSFMNLASVAWGKENFPQAVKLYEKALPYLPEDYMLKEFLGYNYLFCGRKKEGIRLLKEVKNHLPSFSVSKETIAQDYLNKKTDEEGIKAVFLSIDETRESIILKQKKIQDILKKFPHFRAGILQLANTYLQLSRSKEAQNILKTYEKIDPNEPIVNYYLSAISFERYDFPSAWKYLKKTEKLLQPFSHFPRGLQQLKISLKRKCPEPKEKF